MSDDDIERQDTLILDTPPSTPEAQISRDPKTPDDTVLLDDVPDYVPVERKKRTKRKITYGTENQSPNPRKPKKPKPTQWFKF